MTARAPIRPAVAREAVARGGVARAAARGGGARPATAPTRAPDTAQPGTATPDVDTRPEVSTGDGDHDRFAHYIRKADWERAYLQGQPVRALCGKVWVPQRDPERYPICPTCKEIRDALLTGGSSGSDGGDGGDAS